MRLFFNSICLFIAACPNATSTQPEMIPLNQPNYNPNSTVLKFGNFLFFSVLFVFLSLDRYVSPNKLFRYFFVNHGPIEIVS